MKIRMLRLATVNFIKAIIKYNECFLFIFVNFLNRV